MVLQTGLPASGSDTTMTPGTSPGVWAKLLRFLGFNTGWVKCPIHGWTFDFLVHGWRGPFYYHRCQVKGCDYEELVDP